MTPSSSSLNFLERFAELRKPAYSLNHWFITKDRNLQPDEEVSRAEYGEKAHNFNVV